jgi:hypothetical protein
LRPTFASSLPQVGHFSVFAVALVFIISISFIVQADFEAMLQSLNRFAVIFLRSTGLQHRSLNLAFFP